MIDWSQVAQLREEIGAEDFEEVAEMFLAEVEETLAGLEPAGPEIGAQLHFLKGSALNLGLAEFADLCARGEVAARAGGTPEGLDRLGPLFAASRDALDRGLKEGAAG